MKTIKKHQKFHRSVFLTMIFIVCTSLFSQAQHMFYHLLPGFIDPYTWVGLGGDANWNTGANWYGGAPPGAGNTAFFDDTCISNCDPTMNIVINVAGVNIKATYAGTITQTNTITIGASGWTQAAGTFVPSAHAISIGGPFNLSGGTYTATNQTWTQSGGLTISGAPTFNHNSGTLFINATPITITPSTAVFNTVTLNSCANTNTLVGTWTINGDLNFANVCGGTNGLNGGIINASGNVTATNNGSPGTTQLRIVGTGNQIITGASSAWIPHLQIASTGGTVSFVGTLRLTGNYTNTSGVIDVGTSNLLFTTAGQTITPGAIDYNNITFEFCSGTSTLVGTWNIAGLLHMNNTCGGTNNLSGGIINAKGDVTASNQGLGGGTVQLKIAGTGNQTLTGNNPASWPYLEIVSTGGTVTYAGTINLLSTYLWTSGTVDAGTSTLQFLTAGQSITPAAINHNNVTFNFCGGTTVITGTLTVGGTLSFATTVCGGTYALTGALVANGNVTAINAGTGGAATLTFGGNTNTTMTRSGTAVLPSGAISVAKNAANSVSLTTNVPWTGGGQTLSISTGTLNVAGFALSVTSTLSISAGARLICNGGTATAGAWSITGEISCGTGQGISWTGAAGDNLWSTAGNWTNNTVPGATDLALFNSSCAGANCNSNINVAASVRGLNLVAAYPGTLTQQAGQTITIGAAGYSQAGGTFVGGNSAVSSNGVFALSGGTFTATSASWTQNSTHTVSGAPTFNHNNGTFVFPNSMTITPSTVQYYNINFSGFGGSTYSLASGTMEILGLLTMNNGNGCCGASQINSGTLLVKGDANFVSSSNGSGVIRIAGNTNQSITGVYAGNFANLEIASTGGTVSMFGTISVAANYTYTSGTVDWGASTLRFRFGGTIVPGNINYNNVYFGDAGSSPTFNLSTGTMKVLGMLTIDNGVGCCGASNINNGTLEAYGDVALNSGSGGTANLKIIGNANQTVTGVIGAGAPSFEIASTGGTVTLVGTIPVRGSVFRYTSGVVDAGTSTLYFPNGMSIYPGAMIFNNVILGYSLASPTINLQAGTMTVNGTLTVDSGSGCCGASQIINGTIEAKGSVNFNSSSPGSALIKISGTGNQTVTGVNTGSQGPIEIVSTGGTVTLSGTLNLGNSFTYTSGTVAPGTSSVVFTNSQNIYPNMVTLNNVAFSGSGATQNLQGQTLNVIGTLTFDDITPLGGSVTNGTINAEGNVVFGNSGKSGTVALNYTGAVASTLTVGATGNLLTSNHVVAKTGVTTVTLMADLAFTSAGRSFTVTSGTFDLGGYDLTINNVLTIGAGGILKCSGGVFTYGSLVNSGTINCPGYPTYDFNWTGAGGDTNWNTAGNWQGGAVPGATDVGHFEAAYCGGTCDVVLNVNPNARGVSAAATYTGTITQPPGVAVNLGRYGWRQAGGTFVGSNAAFSTDGGLQVSGGSFQMTSATTTLGTQACGTRTMLAVTGGATVTHNNGRVKLSHRRPPANSCNSTGNMNFPNGFTLYDLETEGPTDNGWWTTAPATNGTLLNVVNNYYQYGNNIDFNIDLAGNLFVNHTNPASTTRQVRLMGTGTQEYTFNPGSAVANKIKIEKPSGVVQPAAGNTTFGVFSFELAQGSFTAPTGTFTVGADIWSTLSTTIFSVASGQTYNHNNGLTRFAFSRTFAASAHSTGTITVPAGFNFYDVEVNGYRNNGGWYGYINSGGSTPTVQNNFTHNGTIMNANWIVQGNVTIGPMAEGGTGTMTLNGTGAQSLTAYPASLPSGGTWTINKPSGVVTMYGTGISLLTTGQDLNLVAGDVDLNESVLNVKDQLNISPGVTVTCNNGFYLAGTLNNSGTISCAGTNYVKTVLQDNPKAYYRLGEPDSNYYIGNSAASGLYPGTPMTPGNITYGVNRVSASYTDKSVTTFGSGSFEFATNIPLTATHTFEAWIKTPLPNSAGGWNTLFRALGGGVTGNHHVIVNTGTSRLGVYDNLGGTLFRDSGFAMNLLSSGWHHLVAIGSGASTTFYIDKVNVGTVPIKASQAISHLGNIITGNQQAGNFDEVAIYDFALSQGQIDAHFAAGAPAPTTIVWMEDAMPAGATPTVVNDSWNWVSTNPTPNTGTLAHQSNLVAGMHQHYFTGATALPILHGDIFYVDVYLNPTNPPTEIMIQLNDGTGTPWEHRVFWGADALSWGTLGTNSRRYKGVLPATGQWVRLTFTAAEVGMVGLNLRGVAFTLNDGQVTWDQFGVIRQ